MQGEGLMRIRSVEEVAIGTDELLGDYLAEQRRRIGVSLGEVADATGASMTELETLEAGNIGMFPDPIRLRLVVLAYCEYLGIEPEPMLARLEPYAKQQVLVPPADMVAQRGAPPQRSAAGNLASAGLGFALTLAAGLFAFYVIGTW